LVTLGQPDVSTATSIVTVADSPPASVPMSQSMSCPVMSQSPGPFEPPVNVAPSIDTPAGMESVT